MHWEIYSIWCGKQLSCSVCAEAALVNEYRQVCNACGIEKHQQRNYQGDTGKKFSPKRKRCGLEIYRRFLYCGQGSRFRDFRLSGDFAAAAADDVAYRYPLGNQVASHAVGRRCVEAVAGEELTGCSLCHNAAIKEQTTFVGILRTERDIVAYHPYKTNSQCRRMQRSPQPGGGWWGYLFPSSPSQKPVHATPCR